MGDDRRFNTLTGSYFAAPGWRRRHRGRALREKAKASHNADRRIYFYERYSRDLLHVRASVIRQQLALRRKRFL